MEIYGPEASGKTTIALHLIAEAQRQGGMYVHFPDLLLLWGLIFSAALYLLKILLSIFNSSE